MVRGGWYAESFRHSLAARGVKTNKYMAPKFISALTSKVSGKIQAGKSRLNIAKHDVLSKLHKDTRFTDISPVDPIAAEQAKDIGKGSDFSSVGFGTRLPDEARRRVAGKIKLESAVEDIVKSESSFNRAMDQLSKHQSALALSLLSKGKTVEGLKLTEQQRESLQTAMNAHALALTQAGLPVPEKISEQVDKGYRTYLDAVAAQRARDTESPLRTQLRQLGRDATAATVDALPSLLGDVGREGALSQLSTQRKDFDGLSTEIDDLEKTPFFDPVNPHGEGGRSGANAFVDDTGKFGDFNVPRTSESFNFQPLASGGNGRNVNVVMKDDPGSLVGGVDNLAIERGSNAAVVKTPAETVSEQVESLHSARSKLADVDVSAFDDGNKAFKSGNREGLISAIAELQSQEGKLKDRWDLVSQTHAQLKGAQNHDTSFTKKKGGLFGGFGGGSGADRLVKQTEQLSDVRGEIMKSNNEAFGRRKMLEFRLQRLDSRVPPETWTPDVVTRFSDDAGKNLSGFFEKMTGM